MQRMKGSAHWIICKKNSGLLAVSLPPIHHLERTNECSKALVVLLDESVTTTLYICVIYVYIYICGEQNIVLVLAPLVDSDK